MKKIGIIGAGVAGLAAANYLVDKGLKPTIIDASVPGLPKVCGEVFSPEVITQLKYWGVPLQLKHKGIFHTPYIDYEFPFTQPLASVSRPVIETILAKRAVDKGADLLTHTKVDTIVQPIDLHQQYELSLITQDPENNAIQKSMYNSDTLIIAAGKFFNAPKGTSNRVPPIQKKPKYIGIKGYVTGMNIPLDELHVYMNETGYTGVTYTNEKVVSLCCLADAIAVEKAGGAEQFIEKFIQSFDLFARQYKGSSLLYGGWLTVPVYGFGKREVPDWPHAYFIGDAAAGIYPASGSGLAMGITSARMAVDYALESDTRGYKKAWDEKFSKKLQYAKYIHTLFMHPLIATVGFGLASYMPVMPEFIYKRIKGIR